MSKTNSIVKVFMERDGMTKAEAIQTLKEMREEFNEWLEVGDYMEAEYVLEEYGFEPDYLFDLI